MTSRLRFSAYTSCSEATCVTLTFGGAATEALAPAPFQGVRRPFTFQSGSASKVSTSGPVYSSNLLGLRVKTLRKHPIVQGPRDFCNPRRVERVKRPGGNAGPVVHRHSLLLDRASRTPLLYRFPWWIGTGLIGQPTGTTRTGGSLTLLQDLWLVRDETATGPECRSPGQNASTPKANGEHDTSSRGSGGQTIAHAVRPGWPSAQCFTALPYRG